MGQAGQRTSEMETRWPVRADVAWDWNLSDQVGLGPVISWAGTGAVGPVRPHLRELGSPIKALGFEILIFTI